MANSIGHRVYVFDGFRLDRANLMLYRGETEVTLPPKAIETLAILVEKRGEIVSKDDLIEAVWKDAFVEDSNLSHYLYLLRKALGTRKDGKPYIETLRKRGYRFDPEDLSIRRTNNGHLGNVASGSTGRPLHVERRGNVLAVADWNEPLTEPLVSSVPETSPDKKPRFNRFAVVAGVQFLMLAVAGFVWFNSGRVEVEQRAAQLDVLRLTNGIEVNDATISPDGKYFVYSEIDGDRSRIWLQQTGQSNRIEIVSWTDGWFPGKTFSRDSQTLYFEKVDKEGAHSLYRLPTLGGTAAKVLTGIQNYISFSPDGREFVFNRYEPSTGESLLVIKETDGTFQERPLYSWKPGTPTAATFSWAPDGATIAAATILPGTTDGTCTISLIDAKTGSLRSLLEEKWSTCYRMEWSADGKGIFMIGTRAGESLTTRRDQLFYISAANGKSRLIVTAPGSRLQPLSLGVTINNEIFVVPFNRSSQIWAMDANGDVRTAVQITSGLADGRAGIAPLADGRVAFVARVGEQLNVWSVNQDGSDSKQLIDQPEVLEEIRAGRDGRFIVFGVSQRQEAHVFRVDSNGENLQQLTFGNSTEIDSSISNDGKWLAYDSYDWLTKVRSLYKLPLDGGETVRLPVSNCARPHFSPDDSLISCISSPGDDEIAIVSAKDGTVEQTFKTLPRSTVSFGARWTPDGKAVAYIVTEMDVSNIWIQPLAGDKPRALTGFTSGSIYHFAFSMDGKRLFVARGTQTRDAILLKESD
ncbi:MAG: winged helix-turn-helix domain-containing protein [bacterium]|nr:winged helix-turn-helix domain-containing protein [bacterium]